MRFILIIYLILNFGCQVQKVDQSGGLFLNNSFFDYVWYYKTYPKGYYKPGDTISFKLSFPQAVTVTGTPRLTLTLDTGGTVYADYFSGSGTKTLVFDYVVSPGDEDTNGVSVATAIDLNGGTLVYDTSVNCLTTINIPSGTNLGKIIIYNNLITPLQIVSVSPSPNGNYDTNDTLKLDVTYNRTVKVDFGIAVPFLYATFGSGFVIFDYHHAVNSTTLRFTYKLTAFDQDLDGAVLICDDNVVYGYNGVLDLADNESESTGCASAPSGIFIN
jgi:hypothetical protein